MYVPTAGGDYLGYSGELSGAGVTAESVRTLTIPRDFPPYTSTTFPAGAGTGGGGQYPAGSTYPEEPPPIFKTSTSELDWFRLVALGVGVLIGWKLLK